ncbi:hypothetical protein O6H91_20G052500 [Diphasiastrum complanatum]|uniref:Uncharacterized protein n=1 Tax=Diphasiastrum complanatum TaxID=34168 RepID=A0ACC2AQC5_DIPCM|nr:hypothetical protein O6H91_20G052500 [Diphasiastrum complanatum]
MDMECLCRVTGYRFPVIQPGEWNCPMVDMQIVNVPEMDIEIECPICLEPLIPPPTPDEIDLMLKCGHMLHLTCF